MKLEDKISSLEIEDAIKKVYINAGYETVYDLLNGNFEELINVGNKNKYKYFRILLRFMHDKTIEFNFEKDICFKQKIINDGIELCKLDLSTYIISVLEKYKIIDSKTLYKLIKEDFYQVYKIIRNEIKSEFGYNGCRGLKKIFNITNNDLNKCEEKYQEERKLYLIFLNEYIYLMSYFEENNIGLDKLDMSNVTKNILKDKNINSLVDILYDFNINVIKDIKFNGDSFNYKYYNVYKYNSIKDIIELIHNIILVLYSSKEYNAFKTKMINSSIKDIKIEELNLSEDLICSLKLVGINKLEDILIKSKIEIVSLPYIGKKGYEKIIYSIAEKVFFFKSNLTSDKLCKIVEVLDSYFEFKNKKDKLESNNNKLILHKKIT